MAGGAALLAMTAIVPVPSIGARWPRGVFNQAPSGKALAGASGCDWLPDAPAAARATPTQGARDREDGGPQPRCRDRRQTRAGRPQGEGPGAPRKSVLVDESE